MINALKEKIKGKGTRIVFTEGSDPRILEDVYKRQVMDHTSWHIHQLPSN